MRPRLSRPDSNTARERARAHRPDRRTAEPQAKPVEAPEKSTPPPAWHLAVEVFLYGLVLWLGIVLIPS